MVMNRYCSIVQLLQLSLVVVNCHTLVVIAIATLCCIPLTRASYTLNPTCSSEVSPNVYNPPRNWSYDPTINLCLVMEESSLLYVTDEGKAALTTQTDPPAPFYSWWTGTTVNNVLNGSFPRVSEGLYYFFRYRLDADIVEIVGPCTPNLCCAGSVACPWCSSIAGCPSPTSSVLTQHNGYIIAGKETAQECLECLYLAPSPVPTLSPTVAPSPVPTLSPSISSSLPESFHIDNLRRGLGASLPAFDCSNPSSALQCDEFNRTTKIIYPNKQLSGTISRSLWGLRHVTHIDLSGNHISGTIPEIPQGWNLPPLVQLNLADNNLEGNLPVSVAALDTLFNSFGCQLSGSSNRFTCPVLGYGYQDCNASTAHCTLVSCETDKSCGEYYKNPCVVPSCQKSQGQGVCKFPFLNDLESCVAECNPDGRCIRGACVPDGEPSLCDASEVDLPCSLNGECCLVNGSSACICDSGWTLPNCSKAAVSTDLPQSPSQLNLLVSDDDDVTIIAVSSAVASTLCIAIIAAVVLVRWRLRRLDVSDAIGSAENVPHLSEGQVEIADARFTISNKELRRDRQIGEGSFGVVYSGKWRGTPVAIKEVKVDSDAAREDFIAEASKMSQLRPHVNVISLMGICRNPLCIVTEFAERGSLDTLLVGPKAETISTENEQRIVLGITRGLAHLHAEAIVHRDIAARNVLLDASLTPKLADFGMAREQDDEQYYNQTKTAMGPIRWMAPEQMEKRQYSTHSDVYSYGVLLYEIYARKLPWDGLNNMQVCSGVLHGDRLEVPKSAPKVIRKVMKQCFETKPRSRPAMSTVVDRLQAEWETPPPPPGSTYDAPPLPPDTHTYQAPPKKGKAKKRKKAKKAEENEYIELKLSSPRNFVHAGGHSKGHLSAAMPRTGSGIYAQQQTDSAYTAPPLLPPSAQRRRKENRRSVMLDLTPSINEQYVKLTRQYVSLKDLPPPPGQDVTLSAPEVHYHAMTDSATNAMELDLLQRTITELRDRVKDLEETSTVLAKTTQELEKSRQALEELQANNDLLEAKTLNRDTLERLRDKPQHLVFYRTLVILIEHVFIGAAAATSGFVQSSSSTPLSTPMSGKPATALRLFGKAVSFVPVVGDVGAAIIGAIGGGLKKVRAEQQQNCVKRIAMMVTDDERSEVAYRVASKLVEQWDERLSRLPLEAPPAPKAKKWLKAAKRAVLYDADDMRPPAARVAEYVVARCIVFLERATPDTFTPADELAQHMCDAILQQSETGRKDRTPLAKWMAENANDVAVALSSDSVVSIVDFLV